eukprot:12033563-Alexandrium_andersonii.AAC.1
MSASLVGSEMCIRDRSPSREPGPGDPGRSADLDLFQTISLPGARPGRSTDLDLFQTISLPEVWPKGS